MRGAARAAPTQRNFAAWERLGGTHPDEETPSEPYARLRLEMIDAERAKVLQIRSTGTIAHEVVEDVLADARRRGVDARHPQRRSARARAAPRRSRGVAGTIGACEHLERHPATSRRAVERECEDCVREGSPPGCTCASAWSAGTSACCDSSPRRHATAHFHETGHPVMRSAEPGEDWRWCFVDSRLG